MSSSAAWLSVWRFLTRHRAPSLACALAGIWGWSGLEAFEPGLLDYVVVGAVVIATYELNRITDRDEDAVNCAGEAALAQRHRSTVLWTFLVLAVGSQLLALTRQPRWPSLIVAGVMLLGILYSVPVRRHRPTVRLKAVPIVKNLAAAAGWAAAVVLYPAFSTGAERGPRVWAAFLLMAAGTFVVEVIWDLRDVEGDGRTGLRTIPLLLGSRRSRTVLEVICLAAGALVAAGWLTGRLDWKWALLLVNAVAFAIVLALLPDRVWRWRPLSNVVVIVQAALFLQLGLVTRTL